jgi:hypothetical protein
LKHPQFASSSSFAALAKNSRDPLRFNEDSVVSSGLELASPLLFQRAGEDTEMSRSSIAPPCDFSRRLKRPERRSSTARGKPVKEAAMSTRTLHIVSGDRDEGLVEALRHGEVSAAERLVATYQDRAYRLAIRIAGNAQDAEEIVQDAFLTVIRGISTFRGESAFGSWLSTSQA